MTALTAELLAKRIVVLYAYMRAEDETAEPMGFERVVCDNCGLVVNVVADGFPAGWTTSGDFRRGWRDLCKGCSQ